MSIWQGSLLLQLIALEDWASMSLSGTLLVGEALILKSASQQEMSDLRQLMDKAIASQSKHLIRYNIADGAAVDLTQRRIFVCVRPALGPIGKMHAIWIGSSFATAGVSYISKRVESSMIVVIEING